MSYGHSKNFVTLGAFLLDLRTWIPLDEKYRAS
jgi:hypothetical protein